MWWLPGDGTPAGLRSVCFHVAAESQNRFVCRLSPRPRGCFEGDWNFPLPGEIADVGDCLHADGACVERHDIAFEGKPVSAHDGFVVGAEGGSWSFHGSFGCELRRATERKIPVRSGLHRKIVFFWKINFGGLDPGRFGLHGNYCLGQCRSKFLHLSE